MLNVFHVTLVKVLNIISADQNINMYMLYKKNLKVELHPSKTFFWWLSSNFVIFCCKMIVTFDFGQDMVCSKTWRWTIKKIQLKNKSK